ncbi:MAG: single-stranded DNA-binding protein [Elusimicrobia bacterium]|nr:single-stranded DNA-binding protein [Elusimicrobiota bacterium]
MNIRIPEQNYVLITGRLTHDPDLRFTQKGQGVCSFDVAVNRRYKDQTTGEWKDDTTYVPITVWGPMGERCKERAKKGSPVHIEGRLSSSEYVDKTGQKRKVMRIVARRVQFLAVASAAETDAAPETVETAEAAESETADKAANAAGIDEVPF